MENQFGKTSRLCLEAAQKDGKTILKEVFFTAPFKIMHPFYEKKDIMTVMQQTASAGIMAGDRQQLEVTVREGASMELLSQAYEKIHRMAEGHAGRHTEIRLEKDSFLRYSPLPTIPFGGSDFRNVTRVDLAEESSRFIFSEVLSCGRVAHGEKFQYNHFQNRISILQGGHLVYRDNTVYLPDEMDMEGFGMYEGFTHLGSLILCNLPREAGWIREVRELLEHTEDTEGGVTVTAAGHIVVRILGRTGQKVSALLEQIERL